MEQGKIMEAAVPIVWVGATPTGLTAPQPAQHPLRFFTGRMPFLPPNQQRQSTEGKQRSRCVGGAYTVHTPCQKNTLYSILQKADFF